jgi:SAM-dependent methyltransferase
MSNNDLLTQAEFDAYKPHPFIVDNVEACRARLGLAKEDFRIVDWGCGRGKFVLWLRERGYCAFGVDIDPRPFRNGADLFRSRGHDVATALYHLDAEGKAPLADASFHCVTSWQTLEHVESLEVTAAEWRRITVDGGSGFHIYPCHHRIVEGHLFMPFVHWLPKNRLRRWLLGSCVFLGIEPHWFAGQKVRWSDKVRTYYRYSIDETFYRTPRVIRETLSRCGFAAEFADVASWRPGRRFVRKWLRLEPSSRIMRIWIMNYGGSLGLAVRVLPQER